ncbi:MAG: LptF/LptG family permease [Bacteroidales bacterium]|nr:LptF/LptG family permease [Bacteroidales bacterium]
MAEETQARQPVGKRIKESLKGFLKRLGVKTLDMYMLKSFLGPFIAVFAIVTFILMMQFLWLYIDELVGKGLSFKIILQFLMWGSATLIPYALPLATLLASIMTMGNLGENSELLSMKAAGISLQRILRPLSYVAAFIVIGAFFASNNLIPVAYNKIYTLREDITNTKEEIKIPVGIFYDGIDGFSIRVGARDKDNLMHDIMIYNHTKESGNSDLTIADSGRFSITPDKKGFLITLHNGINYQETNTRTYTDTSLQLQRIRFKFQQIAIPLENYAFTQTKEGKYGAEVMAKNLSQLSKDKDSLTIANDSSLNFHTRRAMHADYLGHLDQLDTARNKGYRKSFKEEELYHWKTQGDKINALQSVYGALNNEKVSRPFYSAQIYQTAYPLRRTIIERYRKFTLSLACLIFFFIGAPIGAIVRKGGLGTPAIISILFFVLYWVVDISGKKLANDGAITPFLGAFISTVVLAPLAAYLTWKCTQDSVTFNIEQFGKNIKDFFQRLFSKTKRLQHRLNLQRILKEEQEKENERLSASNPQQVTEVPNKTVTESQEADHPEESAGNK